jgi:hypothetical protein
VSRHWAVKVLVIGHSHLHPRAAYLGTQQGIPQPSFCSSLAFSLTLEKVLKKDPVGTDI